jgi:hypothetical protein
VRGRRLRDPHRASWLGGECRAATIWAVGPGRRAACQGSRRTQRARGAWA